jgi:hypothetical protein
LEATEAEMEQWVFYFHYEQSCDNQAIRSKTLTGCQKIAATSTHLGSDGLLLLLNTPIPKEYDVYYSGWDRRDSPAQSGVGIHHPAGDYKKISTFNTPVTQTTFHTDEGETGDNNAHWNATFQKTTNGHGITEGGSSGSPLFNENKLVVGSLTGGNSSCDVPDGLNLYGKLSFHWDKYKTRANTRMDQWLDPIGSGAETLVGRFDDRNLPAPYDLRAVFRNNVVELTWKIDGDPTPSVYYVYVNNQKIGETTKCSFTDESPDTGNRTYSVSAVYDGGSESEFASATIAIAEYKAPLNLSATYISDLQRIALLWDEPTYEQTIYWGTGNAVKQTSLGNRQPFYFGQQWTQSDIQPFHKKTITAVKFFPIRNNTYEIYIAQTGRTYSQTVTTTNNTVGRVNTIPLTIPFVIDGTKDLTVALYVSKVSESPIVCDDGPAVRGKGNLYSYDGQTWEQLSSNVDCNVVVSAVIHSTEGELPVSSRQAAEEGVALYSSQPAAFPEVTGYNIYRDKVKIRTVAASPRRYVDEEPLHETTYQVSAVYDGASEGLLSDPFMFLPSDNRGVATGADATVLYPALFGSWVEIRSAGPVKRVEVYAADGRLCLREEHPAGNILFTGSLQPGSYFFRVYTTDLHTFKTLRGSKKN